MHNAPNGSASLPPVMRYSTVCVHDTISFVIAVLGSRKQLYAFTFSCVFSTVVIKTLPQWGSAPFLWNDMVLSSQTILLNLKERVRLFPEVNLRKLFRL